MHARRWLFVLPAAALLGATGGIGHAQIAVVVRADNPIEDLSLEELRRIYLGKATSFEDGGRILLAADMEVADRFDEIVLGMSPRRVKQYWIKAIFSGSAMRPPLPLRRPEAAADFLLENRGAIAFLPAGEATEAMKVLRIDGLLPGEEGYPLSLPSGREEG